MANHKRSGREPPRIDDTDAWLISYADMVTLLLGFFVILYSFSTIDPKKFEKVSQEVAEALGTKVTDNTSKAKSMISEDERKLQYLTLLVSMLNMGSPNEVAKLVEKKNEKDRLRREAQALLGEELRERGEKVLEVVLPSAEVFAGNTAVISDDGQRRIARLARQIKRVEHLVDVEVQVHAPQAGGRNVDKWATTSMRAARFAQQLAREGIPQEVMRASGAADARPLFPERDPTGQRIARHVEANDRVQVVLKTRQTEMLQ